MEPTFPASCEPPPGGGARPAEVRRRWWPTGPAGTFLVGAIIAIVYLLGVTGVWWPTYDSATYLTLGRSLAAGEGYRSNGHLNIHFSPGLPLILAGLRLLTGDGFWVPNLFMAVCGLLALLLIYRTVLLLGASGAVAAATTLATAFSYNYYFNSHRILSDVPFALAFWGLLYATLRTLGAGAWRLPLLAVLTAVAVTVRVPGLLLVGPLALGLVLDPTLPGGTADPRIPLPRVGLGRRASAAAVILLTGGGIAALLCGLVRLATGGLPSYTRLLQSHTGEGWARFALRLGAGLLAGPTGIGEMLTGLENLWPVGLAAVVLALVGMVSLWRRGARLVPTMLVLYPVGLTIPLGMHAIRPRFMLAAQPLLVYVMALGLQQTLGFIAARGGRRLGAVTAAWAVIILTAVLIAPNLPGLCQNAFYYSLLRHRGVFYEVTNSGRYGDMFRIAEILRHDCPPGARAAVPTGRASMLHFLSQRVVVALPEQRDRGRGLTGEILEWLRANAPDVQFVAMEGAGSKTPQTAAASAEGTLQFVLVYRGPHGLLYKRV